VSAKRDLRIFVLFQIFGRPGGVHYRGVSFSAVEAQIRPLCGVSFVNVDQPYPKFCQGKRFKQRAF